MFSSITNLYKDNLLVEEISFRSHAWVTSLRYANAENYYQEVFVPTMEVFNKLDQMQQRLKTKSGRKYARKMIQANRTYFESLTKNLLNPDDQIENT